MGKRGTPGGRKREAEGSASSSSFGLHTSLSLREEASGKKQSHNAKSILKLRHLQKLAEWTGGEASIPSLGAFFGRRFADFGESLGISPDPSLFPSQRCETLLQPGFNCTIRIEKNRAKWQRHRKTNPPTQNNVVYTCHFCSHRSLKRGTPKGYVREIRSLKPEAINSTSEKCAITKKSNMSNVKIDLEIATPSPGIGNVSPLVDSPTIALTGGTKLLDSKRRRRRKPGSKGSADESLVSSAPVETEKASGTVKRRKKSWTTLKEIAESEEHERNRRLTNFSIPFLL